MREQKKHVKVLLATLQMVLWPDSGWKVVGMDKLENPKKVQLFFRKALLVVHPDK